MSGASQVMMGWETGCGDKLLCIFEYAGEMTAQAIFAKISRSHDCIHF
jgi:hypothetical protein